MSGPNDTEPMDIMTPTNSSAPASATKSPDRDRERDMNGASEPMRINNSSRLDGQGQGNAMTMTMPAPTAAAAAVHGPKIVQTAFIHKLYNMLEDNNIQHLIRWSNSEESFVMSPSSEFSKSAVSDVFHNGSPDAPLWEFKHGNNNFKRGDLVGLREIKRRASRHSLVTQKPPPSQPGTPAEPMPPIPDGGDPRLIHLERSMQDLYNRLDRSESNAHYMQVKHQALLDSSPSRPPSPPPTQPSFSNGEGFEKLRSWEWGSATQSRKSIFNDGSAPPTRRGSMAHILNNDDSDTSNPRGDDDRKRKRLA
ncbi:Flocculation suppression protein [Cytospora paraplurivora]|uniref:Flocculation suppression protein n=1 Tax=Cytospora paraplurivora TaxID=2898453 RepID=A0AAN9YL56_9PEZI